MEPRQSATDASTNMTPTVPTKEQIIHYILNDEGRSLRMDDVGACNDRFFNLILNTNTSPEILNEAHDEYRNLVKVAWIQHQAIIDASKEEAKRTAKEMARETFDEALEEMRKDKKTQVSQLQEEKERDRSRLSELLEKLRQQQQQERIQEQQQHTSPDVSQQSSHKDVNNNIWQKVTGGIDVTQWFAMVYNRSSIHDRTPDRLIAEMMDRVRGTTTVPLDTPETMEYFRKTRASILMHVYTTGATSARTMRSVMDEYKRFEKRYMEAHDKFNDLSPDDIMKKLIDISQGPDDDKTLCASSKAKRLQNISRVFKLQGKFNSRCIDQLRKDTFNALGRDAKIDRQQKLRNGCIPLIADDFRHMFNCMLDHAAETDSRELKVSYLQSYCTLLLSYCCGRRFLENNSISIKSFTLESKTVALKTGGVVRCVKLVFKFHELKAWGVSPKGYDDSIVAYDDLPIHVNCVALLLLLWQYRGIISSALDVWKEVEELGFSARTDLEGPDTLPHDIIDGKLRFNIAGMAAVTRNSAGGPFDQVEELVEVPQADIDLAWKKQVDYWVHENRVATNKKPLWVKTANGIPTGTPHTCQSLGDAIQRFGQFCGYHGNNTIYFGVYGARKGAIHSYLTNLNTSDSFLRSAMNSRFMNGASIRHEHYISHDLMRQLYAGGMHSELFDPDIAEALIDGAVHKPAYKNSALFPGISVSPKTDIPDYTAKQFLKFWGEGIKSIGRPLPENIPCPFVECTETFGGEENDASLAEMTRHVVKCPHLASGLFDCSCNAYSSDIKGRGKVQCWKENLWRHVRYNCPNIKSFHEGTTCFLAPAQGSDITACKVIEKTRRYSHYAPVRKFRCPVKIYVFGRNAVPDPEQVNIHTKRMAAALQRYEEQNRQIREQSSTIHRKTLIKPNRPYVECEYCGHWFATKYVRENHWKVSVTCEGSKAESNHNFRMGTHFLSRLKMVEIYAPGYSDRSVSYNEIVKHEGVEYRIGRWLRNMRDLYRRGCVAFKYQHLVALQRLRIPWTLIEPSELGRRDIEADKITCMIDLICDYFRTEQFAATHQFPSAEKYCVNNGQAPFMWLRRQRETYNKSKNNPSTYKFPTQTTEILNDHKLQWLLDHDPKAECMEKVNQSLGPVFKITTETPPTPTTASVPRRLHNMPRDDLIAYLTQIEHPPNNSLRAFWIKADGTGGGIPRVPDAIVTEAVFKSITVKSLRRLLRKIQGLDKVYDESNHTLLPKSRYVYFRTISNLNRQEGVFIQKQFVLTAWSDVNSDIRSTAVANGNANAVIRTNRNDVGSEMMRLEKTTRIMGRYKHSNGNVEVASEAGVPSRTPRRQNSRYTAENDEAIISGVREFAGCGDTYGRILSKCRDRLPPAATKKSIKYRFRKLATSNRLPPDVAKINLRSYSAKNNTRRTHGDVAQLVRNRAFSLPAVGAVPEHSTRTGTNSACDLDDDNVRWGPEENRAEMDLNARLLSDIGGLPNNSESTQADVDYASGLEYDNVQGGPAEDRAEMDLYDTPLADNKGQSKNTTHVFTVNKHMAEGKSSTSKGTNEKSIMYSGSVRRSRGVIPFIPMDMEGQLGSTMRLHLLHYNGNNLSDTTPGTGHSTINNSNERLSVSQFEDADSCDNDINEFVDGQFEDADPCDGKNNDPLRHRKSAISKPSKRSSLERASRPTSEAENAAASAVAAAVTEALEAAAVKPAATATAAATSRPNERSLMERATTSMPNKRSAMQQVTQQYEMDPHRGAGHWYHSNNTTTTTEEYRRRSKSATHEFTDGEEKKEESEGAKKHPGGPEDNGNFSRKRRKTNIDRCNAVNNRYPEDDHADEQEKLIEEAKSRMTQHHRKATPRLTIEQVCYASQPTIDESDDWRSSSMRVRLGFSIAKPLTTVLINKRFKTLARRYHPDRPGGSHQKMASINEARTTLLAMVCRNNHIGG